MLMRKYTLSYKAIKAARVARAEMLAQSQGSSHPISEIRTTPAQEEVPLTINETSSLGRVSAQSSCEQTVGARHPSLNFSPNYKMTLHRSTSTLMNMCMVVSEVSGSHSRLDMVSPSHHPDCITMTHAHEDGWAYYRNVENSLGIGWGIKVTYSRNYLYKTQIPIWFRFIQSAAIQACPRVPFMSANTWFSQ